MFWFNSFLSLWDLRLSLSLKRCVKWLRFLCALCRLSIQGWLPCQPFSIQPLWNTKEHCCFSLQHSTGLNLTSDITDTAHSSTQKWLCVGWFYLLYIGSKSSTFTVIVGDEGWGWIRCHGNGLLFHQWADKQKTVDTRTLSGAVEQLLMTSLLWHFKWISHAWDQTTWVTWMSFVVWTREQPVGQSDRLLSWWHTQTSLLQLKWLILNPSECVCVFRMSQISGFWPRRDIGRTDTGCVSGVRPAGWTVSHQHTN